MAAKKKTAKSLVPQWVEKPHPLGLSFPYAEVKWPPTLPNPTPTVPVLPGPTLPLPGSGCDKPCTKVLTLLPNVLVQPGHGRGSTPIKVDGYRVMNLYVISDPDNSSESRAFTLDVSFAPIGTPNEYGLALRGETSSVYNYDSLGNATGTEALHYKLQTSDRGANGMLPHAGGLDLAHILRVPVIGPYARVIALNRGTVAKNVEVVAYLTT